MCKLDKSGAGPIEARGRNPQFCPLGHSHTPQEPPEHLLSSPELPRILALRVSKKTLSYRTL